MPTIYLKDATFSRLVDSGHYHDYEKVIAKGVELALELEELEKRQIPKSVPGPPPPEPESVQESTSIPTPAAMVTETIPAEPEKVLPRCVECGKTILDKLRIHEEESYHYPCLVRKLGYYPNG